MPSAVRCKLKSSSCGGGTPPSRVFYPCVVCTSVSAHVATIAPPRPPAAPNTAGPHTLNHVAHGQPAERNPVSEAAATAAPASHSPAAPRAPDPAARRSRVVCDSGAAEAAGVLGAVEGGDASGRGEADTELLASGDGVGEGDGEAAGSTRASIADTSETPCTPGGRRKPPGIGTPAVTQGAADHDGSTVVGTGEMSNWRLTRMIASALAERHVGLRS